MKGVLPISFALLFLVVTNGCSDRSSRTPAPSEEVVLLVTNTDSVVDLTAFTQITSDLARDSADAFRMMALKWA